MVQIFRSIFGPEKLRHAAVADSFLSIGRWIRYLPNASERCFALRAQELEQAFRINQLITGTVPA